MGLSSMKMASIRLEDNHRTSLSKMLCPRLPERLPKIKLSEFLYSEWGDSTRGLTPLVGRESEVTLLLERWEQAKSGQGQVILLSGEGGIGKSRLVQMLKEHV